MLDNPIRLDNAIHTNDTQIFYITVEVTYKSLKKIENQGYPGSNASRRLDMASQ